MPVSGQSCQNSLYTCIFHSLPLVSRYGAAASSAGIIERASKFVENLPQCAPQNCSLLPVPTHSPTCYLCRQQCLVAVQLMCSTAAVLYYARATCAVSSALLPSNSCAARLPVASPQYQSLPACCTGASGYTAISCPVGCVHQN